jgi:DNA-binding MarR family transcriptional regulator
MVDRPGAVEAWEALYRAQVSVLRRLRDDFPDEISFNEYDVLFNLFRLPGRATRIRDLNEYLLLTQPSVSRLLDRLVVRGYVTKTPDPADARGTIVTLTDEGLAVFRRVGARHSAAIAREMSALNADELADLTALTTKVRGATSPRRPEERLDR